MYNVLRCASRIHLTIARLGPAPFELTLHFLPSVVGTSSLPCKDKDLLPHLTFSLKIHPQ
jgi:hypothetical protein